MFLVVFTKSLQDLGPSLTSHFSSRREELNLGLFCHIIIFFQSWSMFSYFLIPLQTSKNLTRILKRLGKNNKKDRVKKPLKSLSKEALRLPKVLQ